MENIEVKIAGMHCQGCVGNLTKMLKAVPGVSQVEISLQNKNAMIGYDAAVTGRERFVSVIEAAGFDVI